MIEEARRLPPSMVAIGIAFISLFAVLSLGTIVAVIADDSPAMPDIDELPLVESSEVVDAVSTCTESACDGYGVLLLSDESDAGVLSDELAELWRHRGWVPTPCEDEGSVCFAADELRISIRAWDEIDPLIAPTLLAEVADRELDASGLLYVHYYRCGIIFPCR